MSYNSLEEIVQRCEEEQIPFWRAVLLSDMEDRDVTEEQSVSTMKKMWKAMCEAGSSYDKDRRSKSGLAGGMGGQMRTYLEMEKPLSGSMMAQVIAQALEMGESNACMQRIVAAPTAGACGVLPAVLLPLAREEGTEEEKILEALYTAAGIGQVIASRAFIAGAAGGCQAEIGSASAMAAGALTALRDGSPEQIVHSAAMALKNLLGVVCDPVAGLVEVPCIKRNVIGAVNAVSCADMALAGIVSRIPPDQVIDAMREVGESMHISLKETGEGGLAGTREGRKIRETLR